MRHINPLPTPSQAQPSTCAQPIIGRPTLCDQPSFLMQVSKKFFFFFPCKAIQNFVQFFFFFSLMQINQKYAVFFKKIINVKYFLLIFKKTINIISNIYNLKKKTCFGFKSQGLRKTSLFCAEPTFNPLKVCIGLGTDPRQT